MDQSHDRGAVLGFVAPLAALTSLWVGSWAVTILAAIAIL